jgi:hypothetical protein
MEMAEVFFEAGIQVTVVRECLISGNHDDEITEIVEKVR